MRRRPPAPLLGSLALISGLAAAAGLLAGSAGTALARSEKQLGYSPASVWGPLVRFVRVDENLKIVDKDPEAGYLIFELTQDKKVFRGSVEVIAASKEHGVRFILDVSDRPSYVELAMLERLERKLLAELGPAPSPPRKLRDKKDGDKGKAGGGGGDGRDKEKPPEVQEAPLQPIPEAPTTK
jgi:hypothetical protein